MKYFEYRRYRIKLKIYKFLALLFMGGILFIYWKLRQLGFTSEELLKYIYVFCGVVLIGMACIKLLMAFIRKRKYLNSPLSQVDAMSGFEFEKYLKVHFQRLGYRVKLTPDTNDFGADLVCKNKEETIVVQAKRYKNKVGVSAVQEILGGRGYYSADRCMVVTNSFFTPAAIELAKRNNVELWDRNSINKMFICKQDS